MTGDSSWDNKKFMAPKIKMDRQFLILIYKLESWPHSICFSKGNKTTLTAEIKTIKKLETFSVKEIFPNVVISHPIEIP